MVLARNKDPDEKKCTRTCYMCVVPSTLLHKNNNKHFRENGHKCNFF